MPLQATVKAKNSSSFPAVRPLLSARIYPQILLQTHTCFVTNKHNVDPVLKYPDVSDVRLETAKIELRRSYVTTEGEPAYDPEVRLFELSEDSKIFTPDNADCAVVMPKFIHETEDFSCCAPFEQDDLATEEFFQSTAMPAHEVYFIGFAGRGQDSAAGVVESSWWDTKWNFPIARVAAIASMPFMQFHHEGIQLNDVLLVSGMSFDGASGSPVISKEVGFRTKPPTRANGLSIHCEGYVPEKLIGIMSGHWWFERSWPQIFRHSGLSYITRSTSILHLIEANLI